MREEGPGRAHVLAAVQPCETGCTLHINCSWESIGEGKPPYISLRLLTGGCQGRGWDQSTWVQAVIIYHQFSGIKQHSSINPHISRSEVWAQHVWVLSKVEIKVLAKLHSFLEVSATS